MGKFEDRLLTDLLTEYRPTLDAVELPEPRRGRHRPLWIAASVLGLTGVVTAGVLLTGGGTPAYAVTKSASGDVTVTIRESTGIDGANEELRRLGLPAVVVPVRPGCPDLDELAGGAGGGGAGGGGAGGGEATTAEFEVGKPGEVTFRATGVPPGHTVMVIVEENPGPAGLTVGMALIEGDAPDCVSVPAPGQGGDQPQPTEPAPTAGTNQG